MYIKSIYYISRTRISSDNGKIRIESDEILILLFY